MLQLQSRDLDLEVPPARMRQPQDIDGYTNNLYVQDLIARSAVPEPSHLRRRPCATLWQVIGRLMGRRLG